MPQNKDRKREYDRLRYHANKEKMLEQRREYYYENRDRILARTTEWTAKRIAKHKQIARDLKSGPCMDCGNEFHHCAMDFDHRPDEEKGGTISRLVNNWKISEKVLRDEIAKCDVVCANCHRIRTWERATKCVLD